MNISTEYIKNTELGDGVGYNQNAPLTDPLVQQDFRIPWLEINNAISASGQTPTAGVYTQLATAISSNGAQASFMPNYNAVQGLGNWATYNGGTTTPTSGTGGTPTINAVALNMTAPLDGAQDWTWTKAGGTSYQGQGISRPFTIPPAFQGQACQISFPYKWSGTDQILGVYIYDVTNGVLIPTSVVNLSYGGTGNNTQYFLSTFYPSTSTSYRFIVHVQTTDTAAGVLEFTDLVIYRQTVSQGAVLTDWVGYPTATYLKWGTTASVMTENWAKWRRDGSSLNVQIDAVNNGAQSGGNMILTLPNGFTTSLPVGTRFACGEWTNTTGGTNIVFGVYAIVATSSTLTFWEESANASGGMGQNQIGYGNTVVSTSKFHYYFSLPIAQWTVSTTYVGLNDPFCLSNTLATVNSTTDGTVNSATGNTYTGWDGSPIVANTKATLYDCLLPRSLLPNEVPMLEFYSNITKDWVGANEAYVASYWANMSAGNVVVSTTVASFYGAKIVKATAGLVRVAFSGLGVEGSTAWTSGTRSDISWASIIAASDGYTRWRIRIGKSSGIAEIAPKIRASYTSASLTLTANTNIVPGIKEFDSQLAFNSQYAGAFLCSRAGFLRISFVSSATNTTSRLIKLFKSGTLVRTVELGNGSSTFGYSFSIMVQVAIGDYVSIQSDTTVPDVNVTLQFELDS